MQALSQFGQQEQARKTYELEAGRKDRDKFADMIKLDPVYASSRKAQDRIAKIMDSFVDKMTMMNKKRTGPLSMSDLTAMQQERGLAMAEMNYIKGNQDRLTQAHQAAAARPGVYNQKTIDEFDEQWNTHGTMPDGPILTPAWQNPLELFDQAAGPLRTGSYWEDVGSSTGKGGEFIEQQKLRYRGEGELSEDQAATNWYQGQNVINNRGWFLDVVEENSPQEYQHYVDKADGDIMRAADMWFAENRPKIYRGSGEIKENRSKPSSSTYSTDGFHVKPDGSVWDKNNKMFGPQENVPVSDGTLDNAIVFNRPMAVKNLIPLPARLLQLTDGIESKSGTVQARVHAANNDKTYVIIDKSSLDKITFTKSAMEALGGEGSYTYDKASKLYTIKDGAEDDVMIPVNTQDAKGLIDNWTGNEFSQQLRQLPESTAPTSTSAPDKASAKKGIIKSTVDTLKRWADSGSTSNKQTAQADQTDDVFKGALTKWGKLDSLHAMQVDAIEGWMREGKSIPNNVDKLYRKYLQQHGYTPPDDEFAQYKR